MKNMSHGSLKSSLSMLLCVCMGFCLFSVLAQAPPARPGKAMRPRIRDKATTSSKATIIMTDKDLHAFELKHMAEEKKRLLDLAKRLAATTGEDLDSWQYAEEYQRLMDDLQNAQAQSLWNETPGIDLPKLPAPSLKAQNALKEINERDKKMQETAEAEKKEREKKQKEALEKEAQLLKQKEEEMKMQEQEAAKKKSAMEEE